MEPPVFRQQPPVPFADMRDRATIQAATRTPDAFGQPVISWSDVATVWAKVEPMEGGEPQQAGVVRPVVTHRVTIRYYAGLTTGHRLRLGARVLNIEGLVDMDNRRRQHLITCKEAP